jgi:hypothetical protein
MSKSLWSIVVLGFITIILMVLMMLFSLSAYQGSPAAKRVRFSNLIRETFGFTEVGAGVKEANGHLTLNVEFLSPVASGFKDEVIKGELEKVADFAQKRYDGTDRKIITRLLVRRTEIQGSGCWRRTLEREMTVDKPFTGPPQVGPAPEEKEK